jgi:hypothetical protein
VAEALLKRYETGPQGTFGHMFYQGSLLAFTCEDPDNNNAKGISCIPAGIYKVIKHDGTKYKNVWRLLNVPGREAILIHNGNTIEDTEGCILVGKDRAMIQGRVSGKLLPGVRDSKVTLNKLRTLLPSTFELEVRWDIS